MISSSSSAVQQNLVTDTWIKAPWEEFIALADNPAYKNGRFYYDRGYMRIEMAAVGPLHARENSIVSSVVKMFATLRNIRIVELNNATFRQRGVGEFQPDLSYYIGAEFQLPPRTNSPINLNEFQPPALVIEIGASSVNDDLGMKRLIYERVGVREYWVVDASADDAIAFSISDGRSGEIQESLVLPGLTLSLVEEALQRSQSEDDGAITRWLLQSFS
ncbi:Uma2 family endonuclease [Coleofasciculus sp. FACHB-129]|uniref:Uma2 family endonuclease n=1 Tax=Cyanophyceae TaxID=3028117 RepID=UPI0016842E6F|nr:Uma2 family endonuclease [Coleofasciculus sp. FACHB-129]MBD1897622.1 Uma2 family endonuclease [Coleofasciculus sp. FACHB-129]